MGKRSSKKSTRNTAKEAEVVSTENEVLDLEDVNLRSAPPTTRLRGLAAASKERMESVEKRLKSWEVQSTDNQLIGVAVTEAAEVLQCMLTLEETLVELEKSGYSPPRKSFTASTEEGDVVSVLTEHKEKYKDIMDAGQMDRMTVLKKHPGKGGGLVVESTEGSRMRVASSHVVKLSTV